MPLLPILVLLPLLLADSGFAATSPLDREWAMAIVAGGPVVAASLAFVAVRLGMRRIDRRHDPSGIRLADRGLGLARWWALAVHAVSILVGGWLSIVRGATGDLILVDELLAMAPPLLAFGLIWASAYDIDRCLHESARVRRLDDGRPLWPTLGRGAWVLGRFRVHILMLGLPLLFVLGGGEAATSLVPGDAPTWVADVVSFGCAALVFMIAPLLMRLVLPMRVLGVGRLRAEVDRLIARAGVRVSSVLLWRTDGTVANAAVVGLVPPLRSVLLTDMIVEEMPGACLRGVVAHELGHVRHHHMPWLVASLAAILLVGGAVASVPPIWFMARGEDPSGVLVQGTGFAGVTAVLAAAWIGFGWVSRRYERQADTFAVQTLSADPRPSMHEDKDEDTDEDTDEDASNAGASVAISGGIRPRSEADDDSHPDVERPADSVASPSPDDVTHEAVAAMSGALLWTARLNGVDPSRKGWRHGSIAWRRAHLATLVGQPVHAMPIDALVRRLKWIAAIGVVIGIGATVAVERWAEDLETESATSQTSPFLQWPESP